MDVTDILMEVQNFISALTGCTGDRHYKCITRSEISFETLTNNSTSRAAFSQLKSLIWFGMVCLLLSCDPGTNPTSQNQKNVQNSAIKKSQILPFSVEN